MTQQQAQSLAARLKRVWAPEQCDFHVSRFGKFSFNGRWPDGLYLHIEKEDELLIELVQNNNLLLTFYCDEIEENPAHQLLVARHRPLFRRGCWLSGCPIEATAKEKAEWTQGFANEEIEA